MLKLFRVYRIEKGQPETLRVEYLDGPTADVRCRELNAQAKDCGYHYVVREENVRETGDTAQA